MSENEVRKDRGEFNLIDKKIEKYSKDYKLKHKKNGFYYFILDRFFDVPESEFEEVICDTNFLQTERGIKGHDLGIDALFIDKKGNKTEINILNFKQKETFEKAKKYFFEANELVKIMDTIKRIKQEDKTLRQEANQVLLGKILEIKDLYDKGESPDFKLYLISNTYEGIEKEKKKIFLKRLEDSRVDLQEIYANDIVDNLLKREENINASVQIQEKKFFEAAAGGIISALIFSVSGADLLRMLSEKEEERIDVLGKLGENSEINNLAFDDNVRVFKKIKGKIERISEDNDINKNIEQTALDKKMRRLFFYYNNGITMTCDNFEYDSTSSRFTLKLENLQVVNGQQTVYSLFEAYKQDRKFEVELLCRVYKTKDKNIKTEIAEYTNSQNPIERRDIRAIDRVQKRLEKELRMKEFFYERKKNQYEQKEKKIRLDAQVIGQLLFSYYNEQPENAKNKKRVIFGKEYSSIFNEQVNAERILNVWKLYKFVEKKRKSKTKSINRKYPSEDVKSKEKIALYSYHKYCSFLFLLVIKKISEIEYESDIIPSERYESLYNKADKIIFDMIKLEFNNEQGKIMPFPNYGSFFKDPKKPKTNFEKVFKDYKRERT